VRETDSFPQRRKQSESIGKGWEKRGGECDRSGSGRGGWWGRGRREGIGGGGGKGEWVKWARLGGEGEELRGEGGFQVREYLVSKVRSPHRYKQPDFVGSEEANRGWEYIRFQKHGRRGWGFSDP